MHNESLENWQGVEPNYEYICRCLRWERCVGKGAHGLCIICPHNYFCAGHCWFAIHEPTGRAIAIKTMASGPEATAEVHALQTLHAFDEACAVKHHIVHAFFVKPGVADVHNTPEFTNPAWTTIGMYFYAGGNLLEFRNALPQVRDFPLITAKAVMAQIIEAIAYCHQCGIAHGDIKAENVLLSGTVCFLNITNLHLADFFRWKHSQPLLLIFRLLWMRMFLSAMCLARHITVPPKLQLLCALTTRRRQTVGHLESCFAWLF